MEHSFHGRTLATLSATGNRKVQAGFEPLVAGFVRVPFNDLDAVRAISEHNKNVVVVVMLEIVQGEGGIFVADLEYQRGLRKLCDDNGWLLICDEVQCGMGRDWHLVRVSACRHPSGCGQSGQRAGQWRPGWRLSCRREGGRPVQTG